MGNCISAIDRSNYFEEEFKFIEGYNEKYLISNYGRVISLQSKNPQIKKPGVVKRGYLQVQLSKPDKSLKSELVHRLVAKHFLETYDENLQVDHMDLNKENNRLDNLRMVTNQENSLNKNKQKNKKFKYIGVLQKGKRWGAQIRIEGKQIYLGTFDTQKEAAKAFNLEKIKRGQFVSLNIFSDSEDDD